ncbi:MAG: sigma-54-dependent Fis family transcriptional regulator [Alphaproteobacteria bacterium]|nr:sigma-54-dependent Fis family transcriptional regulator [Alphaproteobacteria bacterium]
MMQEARQLAPDVPFILITAHGDIQMAVKAVRDGAFDFIEKPAPPEHLLAFVARALTTRKLQLENARLRRRVARGANLGARFLGRSAVIRTCRREIISVAPLDVDVLLHGETGTGKELAARCIHDLSGAEGDFVSLNCGSLSEATFDDVMFAESETRPGAIPRARGGTLFLDNVASLSETVQLRLLDVMDRRSGESPFRVIGANPRSLSDAHGAGELRDDLYYRLNLAEIELPPLRERENDVFLLLDHFINESVARHDRRYPTMTADDLRPFKAYHWPGNLRELRNVAEKLVIGLKVRFQNPANRCRTVSTTTAPCRTSRRRCCARPCSRPAGAGRGRGAAEDPAQAPLSAAEGHRPAPGWVITAPKPRVDSDPTSKNFFILQWFD